jgi:hypothetical protein
MLRGLKIVLLIVLKNTHEKIGYYYTYIHLDGLIK